MEFFKDISYPSFRSIELEIEILSTWLKNTPFISGLLNQELRSYRSTHGCTLLKLESMEVSFPPPSPVSRSQSLTWNARVHLLRFYHDTFRWKIWYKRKISLSKTHQSINSLECSHEKLIRFFIKFFSFLKMNDIIS